MKSRRKAGLCKVAPEFEKFREFLRLVGPMPAGPKYTLDRLKNEERTYGPGLVEWRTPKQQANNRSTTIFLTHDGTTLPLTEWAERTGQKPDTLRKRRRRGLSDSEIIGALVRLRQIERRWPGPQDRERLDVWEQRYRRRPERNAELTRLQFFRDWISADIVVNRRSMSDQNAILAFIRDGVVAEGMSRQDMEVWCSDELAEQTPAQMVAAIQALNDRIAVAESYLDEAWQMEVGIPDG